jgi:hypothetical protein
MRSAVTVTATRLTRNPGSAAGGFGPLKALTHQGVADSIGHGEQAGLPGRSRAWRPR